MLHNHPGYVSCACGYNVVNYDAKSLNTQRTTLVTNDFPSPSPSLSFELVSISLGYRLLRTYLSKMVESALAACAKYARPAR